MSTFAPMAPDAYRQPLCPYEPDVRPFNYYTQPNPAAILLRNGHYVRVYGPAHSEVSALEEGVTYFSEGRTYTIDNDTATALTSDGYGEYIS